MKQIHDFINLSELDLKIRTGEFVCVIGDVGSGKSSLFSAINGDMIFVPEHVIGDSNAQKDNNYLKTLAENLLREPINQTPI